MNFRIKFFHTVFSLFFLFLMFSCANRGMGPQGGPRDTTPPQLLRSKPPVDKTNYTGKTIELEFDEFIQTKDVYTNVVISPPQKKQPVMKVIGKKFFIELADTIQPNTTYTVDFGNAIRDNNEGNELTDFSFAFSTGDDIDTLVFTGTLVDAQTLNPIAGSFIGIHSNLNDTTFTTTPFLRMTRTNSQGEFTIKNVKEGNYHIFALTDQNSNYYFDQPVEAIAFLDSLVMPVAADRKIKTDTVKTDTLLTDSTTVPVKPAKLILYQFTEEHRQQYLAKTERKEKEKFTLYFNAPLQEYPGIEPLNFESDFLIQPSADKDTLTYWLKNKNLMEKDTLEFVLYYPKSDSIGELFIEQDTLKLPFIQPQAAAATKKSSKKEKEEAPVIEYLTYNTNASKSIMEYYALPTFTFNVPVSRLDLEKIHLRHKISDTIWENVAYELNALDSVGIQYQLLTELDAGEKYAIELDSAAFTSIYDNVTLGNLLPFGIRPLQEYTTLIVNARPFQENIVIQLLNEKDQVVMQEKAESDGTFFEYLTPGVYYIRLFIDENGNGKWDTGNFSENRQPEKIYYFNKRMSLRANWEVEENWNYLSLPILEQKPAELKIDPKKK